MTTTTATTGKRPAKPRPQVPPLTVSELVSAARQLEDGQWLRLLTALDRIEEQRFRKDRELAAKTIREKGITDDDLDEDIMRRRREGGR